MSHRHHLPNAAWARGMAWFGLCLGAVVVAHAAEPTPDQVVAERRRIADARAAVHARHAAAEQACASEFQLNRCLALARADRRQALDQLKREQLALDDLERRRRAEQRLQMIERRRVEASARAASGPMGPASAPAAASAALGGSATAAAGRAGARAVSPQGAASAVGAASSPKTEMRVRSRPAPPPGEAAQRAAEAQRRAEATAARQAAAASHAETVARRNAERDARKPPAAGLPVPGPGSAAGALPAQRPASSPAPGASAPSPAAGASAPGGGISRPGAR